MSDIALVLPLRDPDLGALPLELLRAHRRELLQECARVARWRRLVQARLDLAVHAAAPVEDLLGACPGLREVVACGSAPGGPGPGPGAAAQLREVDEARRELTGYAARLSADLAAATEELVERYTRAPGECLLVGASRL